VAEHRTTIDIDAAPETVFQFLVTDTGMTSWMGQWASLDAVPGGQFAVDIAGYPARGMFLEVDPPRRVTISWGFAGSVIRTDAYQRRNPGRGRPHRSARGPGCWSYGRVEPFPAPPDEGRQR
jgi:uncharacterized protein YndB with AHSA1/START domain